jgi:hypothetical protein
MACSWLVSEEDLKVEGTKECLSAMRSAPARRKSSSKSPVKQNERLLPIPAFSDRVGMSVAWTRKRVQARDVAYVRIGRRIVIPESEIARIISEGLTPAKVAR